jgi:hypothetical protein
LTVNAMRCKSCGSQNVRVFKGEIAIHFPGLEGLNEPIVWVFPELHVCLDCGQTEFTVPDGDLRRLRWDRAAGAS